MRLSDQQRRALVFILNEPRGWLPHCFVTAMLLGLDRYKHRPFTNSERASASRSMRRLAASGLVTGKNLAWWPTEAGRAEAERLALVSNWTHSLTDAPSELERLKRIVSAAHGGGEAS